MTFWKAVGTMTPQVDNPVQLSAWHVRPRG